MPYSTPPPLYPPSLAPALNVDHSKTLLEAPQDKTIRGSPMFSLCIERLEQPRASLLKNRISFFAGENPAASLLLVFTHIIAQLPAIISRPFQSRKASVAHSGAAFFAPLAAAVKSSFSRFCFLVFMIIPRPFFSIIYCGKHIATRVLPGRPPRGQPGRKGAGLRMRHRRSLP